MQRCYFFSEVAVLQKKKSYINNFTTYPVVKTLKYEIKMYEKAIFEQFSFLCIIKYSNAYDKDYISIGRNVFGGCFFRHECVYEKA
jgi:hypothetical protein